MVEETSMDENGRQGVARFHFDPERVTVPIPSRADVEEWVRVRMRTRVEEKAGLAQAVDLLMRNRTILSVRVEMLSWLPGGRRRLRQAVEDEAFSMLEARIESLHRIMMEYMVDLLHHSLTDILEATFAMLLREKALAQLALADLKRRKVTREEADAASDVLKDIERTIEKAVRQAVESEAVNSLLHNRITDGERALAGLRAALDEVGSGSGPLADEIENLIMLIEAGIQVRESGAGTTNNTKPTGRKA